jgi:hypothetical protein
MTIDEYGEIINSHETYSNIAEFLNFASSCFIGWTDGKATHHDILFTLSPSSFGRFQGGIKPNYLFVSIMRVGAFAFRIEDQSEWEYYDEKLTGNFGEELGIKIAELINGVKRNL